MTSKPFYVYILIDPLDDRPIYVGKGRGKRFAAHGTEARRGCECRKCCAIREVWDAGRDVRVDFVFETDSEHAALDYEKDTIIKIGLQNLTNVVEGHAPWYEYPPERVADTERVVREWDVYRAAIRHKKEAEKEIQRLLDRRFVEEYYAERRKTRRQKKWTDEG